MRKPIEYILNILGAVSLAIVVWQHHNALQLAFYAVLAAFAAAISQRDRLAARREERCLQALRAGIREPRRSVSSAGLDHPWPKDAPYLVLPNNDE